MQRLLVLLLVCFTVGVSSSAVIDSSLQKRLFLGDSKNVLVSFTESIEKVFDTINSMRFSSLEEKRAALTDAQEGFTNAVQQPLQTFLSAMGVDYKSFWISNSMVIPNVDSTMVQFISSIPGVASIQEEPVIKLTFPTEIEEGDATPQASTNGSWGITKIRADQVWATYKGKGIVVAGIDTGVRYTHEALKANWRSSYGWFDPYKSTTLPNDQNGHGTHTMGTIVGTTFIGVAPEATWIACKGCNNDGCSTSSLLACGQWVQCPTKPDGTGKNCGKAPNVVSNSWGGPGGNTFFNSVINSWKAAGIMPVFSAGNDGPACTTLDSPGDQTTVIAVASTDFKDRISYYSSRGPSSTGKMKPDISAPGSQIRSAWHTSDTAYKLLQGTSMACPHVSGVAALMLQKKSTLTYNQIYKAMTTTTVTKALNTTNANTCGGKAPKVFPNYVFGYGRIDAVNAVKAVS